MQEYKFYFFLRGSLLLFKRGPSRKFVSPTPVRSKHLSLSPFPHLHYNIIQQHIMALSSLQGDRRPESHESFPIGMRVCVYVSLHFVCTHAHTHTHARAHAHEHTNAQSYYSGRGRTLICWWLSWPPPPPPRRDAVSTSAQPSAAV